MVRVIIAAVIVLAVGLLGAVLGVERGTWGEWALLIVGAFAVSAVLPHYLYRGEPLFPDRRKRR